MEEILTVNGQSYRLELSAPLSQEQRNYVIKKLGGNPIKSTGCSSCGNKAQTQTFHLGTGTCTTTIPIIKGKTRVINCTSSSTNPTLPYTYTLTVPGAVGSPFSHTGNETSWDFSVPFPSVATVGITLSVIDACVGGTPDTATCTATLVDSVVTNFIVTPSSCTVQIGGAPCSLTVGNCTDQAGNSMTCTTAIWSAVPGTGTISVSNGIVTGLTVGSAIARCVIGTKTIDTSITITSAACTKPICDFTII